MSHSVSCHMKCNMFFSVNINKAIKYPSFHASTIIIVSLFDTSRIHIQPTHDRISIYAQLRNYSHHHCLSRLEIIARRMIHYVMVNEHPLFEECMNRLTMVILSAYKATCSETVWIKVHWNLQKNILIMELQ